MEETLLEKIKSNLCYYDTRNPTFEIKEEFGYDKEDVDAAGPFSKKSCACDNCFYGRTSLAELFLGLLESSRYTEEDMLSFSEWTSIHFPNQARMLGRIGNLRGFRSTKEIFTIWKNRDKNG